MIQWRATAALSRERERERGIMESTGREKEKEKEKGRWREENGGPVKCRWRVLGKGGGGGRRGSCVMGRGREGVVGGLSSLFFPFREHPLLFSIVPLGAAGRGKWEGEKKTEAPGQPGAAPSVYPPTKKKKKKKKKKKQSQPGGPWGQNLKQNTLKLTQHFFF